MIQKVEAQNPSNSLSEGSKVLVDDAVQALKNRDISKALVHLNLLNQQLVSSENSSSVRSAKVLVDDANAALKNNDTRKALVHLNLIQQQLTTPKTTSTLVPTSSTNSTNPPQKSLTQSISNTSKQIPSSISNKFDRTDEIIKALVWISKNTPKNSVFASWWDYGDWIRDVGNRTSLADSTTTKENKTRIEAIAKMFIDKPEDGLKIARQLKANYILIYIVAQRYATTNGSSIYSLGSGGDETKKHWFMRIGGFNESNYLEKDDVTPKQRFWNTTLLGRLIPFTIDTYASANATLQQRYSLGSVALYSKDIKYPNNNGSSQPFSLVYSSDSFNSNTPGEVPIVFIYKVNNSNFTSQK